MDQLNFIYKRQSTRKFKDTSIPKEDLQEIIKAASFAPSAKNVQNWHFVVITNPEKIQKIVQIIEEKNASLAEKIKDEQQKTRFTKFLRFATFFRTAPALVLFYTEDSYTPTGLDVLQSIDASKEEIDHLLRPNPALQNIGAAIENFMLAASNMGYGGCWMTSPMYAAKEIEDYIGLDKEGYFLASLSPLGIPEGDLKSPPRKPVEEIATFIE